MQQFAARLWPVLLAVFVPVGVWAQAPVIPHNQSKPPGPPLSPEQALAKLRVPEGFRVELVACEPQIVNPVAMAFDERGRIWVTESLEYPRFSAGPGKDRIKILEDTDRDGKVDKVTIFAEGLNIPSGIALGYGGVWVANAPDILFLKDTDGDDRADERHVVVTGFGRADTHELPNSLTWGPDGYLYGLNGVFNPSKIEQEGRVFEFTCAMFRIDPRTWRFELFAEGTSNPWGIAWDPLGSAFISACVVDHLWHITESGYYHRQSGAYPPFTWKLGSIVSHTHQKAAYCGLHYFDSDAYPEPYRDRLYMGNIHGNCINVDKLQRHGSTYVATPEEDFLATDDVWFMPVAQKTGPDGCLYILDWYDRYHCYQDARRDPEGIDRLRGRLYRVRYGEPRPAPQIDLRSESSRQLVERLGHPNLFIRETATRLLAERQDESVRPELARLVLEPDTPLKLRMHALWALIGYGPLPDDFHQKLLDSPLAELRMWGVRAAGNQREVSDAIRQRIIQLAEDPSPDVQLQVAIAARKITGIEPLPLLVRVAAHCGDDPLIPAIIWQNLHPLLPGKGEVFLREVRRYDVAQSPALKQILPRATERLLQ
ncbi:MAG: hypothetical protein KatS3mg110_0677 [Pirellulaceae bacterium]|nr:MAG: hypothetical protein KatS3mg110_0677 [Pirellulaceae bacterium]